MVKGWLKQMAMRAMRPGLLDVYARLDGVGSRVGEVGGRVDAVDARVTRVEEALEKLAGATIDREKHREELAYWRWLIKTEAGQAALYAPFEVAFGTWQRERLLELGKALGLCGTGCGCSEPLPVGVDHDVTHRGQPQSRQPVARDLEQALDAWCGEQSVVEIGAGPYPAVAAAPRWRRAVAVDPLAKSYAEEGLLPAAAEHVTYLEAPGERVPLPAGFADLVIIENALDHVSDPAAVLVEIRRLLRDGGLLWLLVDLSNHCDPMHPHPFDEARARRLLREGGFEVVSDRVSDHKSHPKAYGEYRALLRKAAAGAPGKAGATAAGEAIAR